MILMADAGATGSGAAAADGGAIDEGAADREAVAREAVERSANGDPALEVIAGRAAQVGTLPVRRLLPTRGRRTIGAWCFIDQIGPASFDPGDGMAVPPHPHIGLQTVTWLFNGAALHRDSLGTEQLIRPGQLNLMTAGRGIAHAEEDPDGSGGAVHGVQLWLAQPSATRAGSSSFEHLIDLPVVDLGNGAATVLIGPFGGAHSPARRDTDHAGVELDLRRGTTVLPLDPAYEHGLVVASGSLTGAGTRLAPGAVAYLAPGADELAVTADGPARALLVGGVPFAEEVAMWWNFVARTQDELAAAYRDWTAGSERFGTVTSSLPRIDVGPPSWFGVG
jgi:redox-sensitive bicupin YhaK (pirin superfamily)